jgi:hypothetical protein
VRKEGAPPLHTSRGPYCAPRESFILRCRVWREKEPSAPNKGDHIIAPNVCTRESQIYTNARLFMPPVPWGVSGDHLSYRYHEEHLSTQDNPCYLGVIRNFKIASTACAWEERYPPQNCYLYGIQSLGASVSQL